MVRVVHRELERADGGGVTESEARELAERENEKGRDGVVYVATCEGSQGSLLATAPVSPWYVRRTRRPTIDPRVNCLCGATLGACVCEATVL